MRKRTVLAAGILFAVAFPAHPGGDPRAGKAMAGACAACHGADGQGVAPNPALAGKTEEQLLQALKDFKSGKRPNAAMKMIARQIREQDMPDIAAYFSSLKKK